MRKSNLARLNIKSLQEYAANNPEKGYCYLYSQITHGNNNQSFLEADNPIIDTHDEEQRLEVGKFMKAYSKSGDPFHTSIPCIFAWPNSNQIDEKPHYNNWVDIKSLTQGLIETNLFRNVDEAFLKLDPLFGEDHDLDYREHKAVLLLVGLWRPTSIDSTFVGLSEDKDARRLEIRAFYLRRPKNCSNLFSLKSELTSCCDLSAANSKLLELVSGETPVKTPFFLGFGALGSAMLDYSLRGGTTEISVMDKDIFLPHNIARHQVTIDYIPHKKSETAKHFAHIRSPNSIMASFDKNILELENKEFLQILGDSQLIIDTTGSARVRRHLSHEDFKSKQIFRAEIYMRSFLGVSFITSSTHNLGFLYAKLISLAYKEDILKEWLKYEASRNYLEEELLIGFGCSSSTTKMPVHQVQQHASALFSFCKANSQCSETGRIAINPVSPEGYPVGLKTFDIKPSTVFARSKNTSNWRIIVDNEVIERIQTQREKKSPTETGGYIYGTIDEAIEEIYIVAVSSEPPNTQAKETSLELGPAGQTGFEKAFMRRTQNRLFPVGSWHSHPTSSPKASQKDRDTVRKFQSEDRKHGFPTVMLITGNSGDEAYVLVD